MALLAIDATPVVPVQKGLGIFFTRLLDALELHGLGGDLLVYVDATYAEQAMARWPSLRMTPVKVTSSLLWELRAPGRCARDGVDVLLTGRDRTVGEPRVRTLVYLFEIPDYRVQAQWQRGVGWKASLAGHYLLHRFRHVARRVSQFVISSRATRDDLTARYAVPSSRIELIYPGTDDLPARMASTDAERAAARTRFASGRRYVLHFATGDQRDNSVVALRSFAAAVARLRDDTALLLVGLRKPNASQVLALATDLGIAEHVTSTGYLSDDEVRLAYAGASAYLDPTLFEGFGFQLAEAMAAGVPVIASNTTSVPEVVGDAGLLCAPDDVQGFADGLTRVLTDAGLSNELIARGATQCRTMRWEAIASGLIRKMREMVDEPHG